MSSNPHPDAKYNNYNNTGRSSNSIHSSCCVMPRPVTHFAPATGLELGLIWALFRGAFPYIRLVISQRPPPGLQDNEGYFSRSEKKKKQCLVFLISKRSCQSNVYGTPSPLQGDGVTQGKEPSRLCPITNLEGIIACPVTRLPHLFIHSLHSYFLGGCRVPALCWVNWLTPPGACILVAGTEQAKRWL